MVEDLYKTSDSLKKTSFWCVVGRGRIDSLPCSPSDTVIPPGYRSDQGDSASDIKSITTTTTGIFYKY